jgi:hypothetical protein
MSRNVAIPIFPEVELLDFAGRCEMFTAVSAVVNEEIARQAAQYIEYHWMP